MEVGDASSGAALQRVLGVLVRPPAGALGAPRAHAARGHALRAARRRRRLARARRLPPGARATPSASGWRCRCACRCCPRPPRCCELAVERFGPPGGEQGALLDQDRAERAARGCARRSRRCAPWPGGRGAARRLRRSRLARARAARGARAGPGVTVTRTAEPAPARRACAGATGRPAAGRRRSGRVAARVLAGRGPLVDGRRRCAAATGSWSARAAATSSSSTTSAPARWFVQDP